MLTSNSLIVQTSPYSPEKTLENVKAVLQAKGITLFALIDHSAEAQKGGLELRYEQLLIFGDPKTGTYLMQENPAIGIELPLKILIWQTSEGITQIGYKDPLLLAKSYGIKKNIEILEKIGQGLSQLINHSIK